MYLSSLVVDKTLKGIQLKYDSTTKKFFRAPGSNTKYFEHIFFCRLMKDVKKINTLT